MKNEHIAWVDLLRVVACFLVVLAHSCDPFVAKFDAVPAEFLSGAFWGSLLRPCVPLFVMISGVLLLPVKMDMGVFYRRRLSRVVIPLFFWAVVSPICYYLYFNSGIQTLNPSIDITTYTWDNAVNKILTSPFNFNYDTTPLWYLYMLVGLYLILPIVSAWVNTAPQRDMKRFLWIWVFTTTLPYIQLVAPVLGYTGNYGNMNLLGMCDWNLYGTFHYFSGFLGYIILAYYLVRFPLNWSWRKVFAVSLPLWILGYAITAGGFIITQKYSPGSFAALEIIWYFTGVNVLMMTFPVFIIMQKIKVRPSALLTKIASLTFGIYLCHFLLVQVSYDVIYPYIPIAPYLQIPLIALASFLMSLALTWLLSKLPFKKYLIG